MRNNTYALIITIRKLKSSDDAAQAQRGNHPPQRANRWIGDRVDHLEQDQQRAVRAPGAREDLHPVHDEADPQQGDEEPQQALDDLSDYVHVWEP